MLDLNPEFSNKPNRKTNPNFNHHANYRFNDGVHFRLETTEEDPEVSSPPLWRTDMPDSPVRFTNPRALSPASRAQAIARGQREIMEMVENMPETSYELSLKDMVEQRREFVDETQSMEEGEEERSILRGGSQADSQRWKKSKKGSVKRQESSSSHKTGRIIVKNGSMSHNKGLLINMFFPFSIGTKRKSSSITTGTSFGNNSNSVKFSLKPELLMEKSSSSTADHRRDWWWKKYTGSGDSESLGITSSSGGESTGRSGSSGSSGSSGGGSVRSNSERNKSGCKYGCWSFFPSRKKKS